MALHAIIWSIIAALYAPVFRQLYRGRWESIDYTHAYFILPLSLWFTWRARAELRKLITTPYTGRAGTGWIFPLLIGLLMFLFGRRGDYLFISTLSMIPILFGLIGYVYGAAIAQRLAFPIVYLLLLVPPPLGVLDGITLPMRYGISVITENILTTLHYPVTRSGLLLSIGGSDIYMGAPCSGFRSLITMISLGLAYVYVIKGSLRKKSILLASIVPLALLGNLIRVLGMCVVTFHFGGAIGLKYHDISGYAVFLALIGGLLGIESAIDGLSGSHE